MNCLNLNNICDLLEAFFISRLEMKILTYGDAIELDNINQVKDTYIL